MVNTRLTEIEEDYFLLLEANKRIEDNRNNKMLCLELLVYLIVFLA